MKTSDINYSAFQSMLNPFTQKIKDGVKNVVVLRNHRVMKVEWAEAEAEYSSEKIQTTEGQEPYHIWNLDGTSIKGSDWDMVAFFEGF